jgi:hypothetical protein
MGRLDIGLSEVHQQLPGDTDQAAHNKRGNDIGKHSFTSSFGILGMITLFSQLRHFDGYGMTDGRDGFSLQRRCGAVQRTAAMSSIFFNSPLLSLFRM